MELFNNRERLRLVSNPEINRFFLCIFVHIGELEFVPLLLHRSPFVDTSADPADAQSLRKIPPSNNSDAAPEYHKLTVSEIATTRSVNMRGRVTA